MSWVPHLYQKITSFGNQIEFLIQPPQKTKGPTNKEPIKLTAVEEMLFALDDDSDNSEENPKEAMVAAAPAKQASSLRD